MSNKKINQVKAGVVLNYAVIGLNAFVGLLYTPFLLRCLGQSEYGLYSLVSSIIAYLSILDLGFGSSVVRYTARLRAQNLTQEQYKLFGMFLVLYAILGAIAFCLGLGLYFNVDTLFGTTMSAQEISRAGIMMLLLVINLTLTFPLSTFGSIIQAYENFVFLKLVEIIRILLTTIVMICLLFFGYKAIALVFVQTVFNLMSLVLHWIYCFKILHIKILFGSFDLCLLKEVSKYSFWIFIMIIVDRIYWGTGQFVLGSLVGTVAVAIFSVAIQLHTMYQQFSTAISSIFLPRVSSMVAINDNANEISALFIKTGRLQYIVMSFILSAFIIFGKAFITLWAGEDYYMSFWIALLFLVPSTIPLVQNLGIVILQARNQMKFRSLAYMIISLCSLVLQIIFVRQYGVIGCAIAICIALVVGQIIVMNIYYSYSQKIDIKCFWVNIIKMTIVPTIICCICCYTLAQEYIVINDWRSLIIGIVVFCIVYLPLTYKWQMNNYERNIIRNLIKFIK